MTSATAVRDERVLVGLSKERRLQKLARRPDPLGYAGGEPSDAGSVLEFLVRRVRVQGAKKRDLPGTKPGQCASGEYTIWGRACTYLDLPGTQTNGASDLLAHCRSWEAGLVNDDVRFSVVRAMKRASNKAHLRKESVKNR